jgi:hypothetical protein
MTMWELAACVEGVNYANGPSDAMEAPTDEEFDRMLEAYDHSHATRQ